MAYYFLTLDQGTTSSRSIIFTADGKPVNSAQIELKQHFPKDGWVEHDAEEIWAATLKTARDVFTQSNLLIDDIIGIGITNQRETTVIWDRKTGQPIHNAIVWQDRRTAALCEKLHQEGLAPRVAEKTGLLIDPYFSATKIAWILDHVPGARARAEKGELAFGTIDCFLLWRLTKGRVHATDATNASRTLLFNIHQQCWDNDLLALFNIPASLLPEVKDSCADYGMADDAFFGGPIAIRCLIGDQQAATVGQTCFKPGMIKSTYGTGCFVVLNTGDKPVASTHRLLTTVAYRINNKVTYALEGSIFNAGTVVQWLRDGLQLISSAHETEALAKSTGETNGVYFVPAFTGLGAPYWDPQARGALFGLTRDTSIAHLVRAALEAVCYQSRDLLEAMKLDFGAPLSHLRVDGGMAVNDWLMQSLADIVGITIDRPHVAEITALGAAYLTGLQAGTYSSLDDIANVWQLAHSFEPRTTLAVQEKDHAAWKKMVNRVLENNP